ncbi:nitroreductase family protein [bacterium]|nr:nitroreductase family protein [bacterium]
MNFINVVLGRRSIRKFKPDKVPRELIEKVLNLALWAPSAMNSQNWKFIILKGHKVEELRAISGVAFKEHVEPALNKVFAKYPDVIGATGKYFETLGGSPVAIAVYRGSTVEGLIPDVESVAAATQNLVLAAHFYGLGSCWMTGILPLADKINKITGENELELQAIVTLGYPDIEARAPRRKEGRVKWIGWD